LKFAEISIVINLLACKISKLEKCKKRFLIYLSNLYPHTHNSTRMALVVNPLEKVEICISAARFKANIEALANIAVSTVLIFDRVQGLRAQVIHPEHAFRRDFQLAPTFFEWTENYDLIPLNEPIRLPIDLGVLLQFFINLPKECVIRFCPIPRSLQGVYLKAGEEKATEPYTFSEQTDILDVPSNVNEIFPAVNNETYPFLISMSKNEFSRQVQLALVDQKYLQIAIIGSKVVFYAEDDAQGCTVIPCKRLEHTSITNKASYLQSFNEIEKNKPTLDRVREYMKRNPTVTGSQFVEEKEHGKIGAGRGITQVHSLRFLTFACKANHDCSEVIIAMSPQYGVTLLFPLTGSLDKDRVLLNENSYFRYQMLPSKARQLLPLPIHALQYL
jgi:hypothetical protein